MAVVVYQCSVCNRTVQLRENPRGVNTVGLCVITEGCRGRLSLIDRLEDATIPERIRRESGFTNRTRRNALFNFVQPIDSNVWTIRHNLNTNPVVQVAVNRPDLDQPLEIEPERIELIDANTIRVTFSRPETGIAQLLARSTGKPVQRPTQTASIDVYELSVQGTVTIGTFDQSVNPLTIGIVYVEDGVETLKTYNSQFPANPLSPWNDTDTVVIRGKEYKVRTFNIGNPAEELGIEDGASFYFSNDLYPLRDTVVLLAQPPFDNADKIQRRVLFPEGIGAAESLQSLIYTSGELFAVDGIAEEVYPPVFIVND